MALYQLPRLKNEKKFEEFICDLFNELENTDCFQNTEYQNFGVKGQKQKGIDIYSPKSKTVIQCKLKDNSKKADAIRKVIINDIHTDLKKAFDLQFEINRFIFVSTFPDDSQLQEFTAQLQDQARLPFPVHYWGWDTLTKYAEESIFILRKYFPKFIAKNPKVAKKAPVALPDGSLGADLTKKNYVNYLNKRYGKFKQAEFDHKGLGEKFSWPAHNKSLMNRYHSTGINFIPVHHFEELVSYLKGRIDKTVLGRNRKSKLMRNYSSIEEHAKGIED